MQRRRNQKASQKIMRSTWEVDYTEAHTDDSESHNTTEGGDDEENNSSSSVTTTNYSYPSLECVKAMKRNFPCLRRYVCRRRLSSCVAIFTIGIISIGLIVTLFYGKSNFFGEELYASLFVGLFFGGLIRVFVVEEVSSLPLLMSSYDRRNLNLYHRGGGGGAPLPSSYRNKALLIVAATAIYTAFLYNSGGAGQYLGAGQDPMLASAAKSGMIAMSAARRKLQIASWNIAAINNNPFEYWITYDENANYEKIMSDIESFLEEPGDKDVQVSEVFTNEMFSQLEKRMVDVGWESVRSYYESDFMTRKIVSGFMKDPLLGSKRLASMPDRITNTINVVGSDEPVCRPTVINMYDGDLSNLNLWWTAWEKFMFDTPLTIQMKDNTITDPPYKLLQPIKKAKYPDITLEEEKVSLPLQTMCGAIFDAILVHMMNTVSTPDVWQSLKKTMVENLNRQKVPHTLDILGSVYGSSDIITLQETSSSFLDLARNHALLKNYWIVSPGNMDAVRDQNSAIFLKRDAFPAGPSAEITALVEKSFEEGVDVPIAKGDILAITATDRDGIPFVIVSFHGDTNGLATKPVLSAIMKAMSLDSALSTHKLIFGLDANTYEKGKPGKTQDVMEWGKHYVSYGLTSCWGDLPSPSNYTTFNSRTYLQTQLNKACKKSDKRANGDVNPKDFILFGKNDFKVTQTWKDNTGEKMYIENMAFPTLKFPSDHGILATVIEPISPT